MEQFNLPPFYEGQKVICVNKNGWHDEEKKIDGDGPKFKEVVTIAKCIAAKDGHWILEIKEYPSLNGEENAYYYRCTKTGAVLFVAPMRIPLVQYSKVIEKESVLVISN